MSYQRKFFICLFVAFFPSIGITAPLITLKEAALPAASGALATRGISRGPAVKTQFTRGGHSNKLPIRFQSTI